jgi:WD40 repeat protein
VWRIVDGELANESVISTGETILALSQHEGVVIVGSMDVHIFTASDPSTQRRMYLEIGDPKDPPLLVVGFTPTGQLAVAGTDDHSNEVKLLPKVSSVEDFPTTPSSSFHVGDNPSCVYSLAISPVGGVHVMAVSVQPGTLFKADGNKLVHLVDYTSGQHLHTIDIGKGGVQVSLNMAFSPDGGNLAIACVDVVSIWSVETGKLLRTIAPKDSSSVNCLCYSPTSPHIAVGCQEGKVKVYSTKEWTLLFELQSQQEEIASVAFSLDGCLLATGCKDGSIALWKTET